MKQTILFFSLLLSTFTFSQSDTTYDMETYLKANGTISYYSSVVDRMFDFLKSEYESKNVPESVWTELESVKTEALTDITELIGQVYEGHFSKEEIQTLLEFYSTETGRKVNAKSELTVEDTQNRDIFYTSELGQKISEATESLNNVLQKVTQSWSADLYKNVAFKLKEKGYIKDE